MANETPKRRFFAADLTASEAVLAGPEAHHAMHVLRLGEGERLELFDGQGRRADGIISRARRGELVIAVDAVGGPHPRPSPRIHLGFSPPKGKRLDWLLEKAAELGAASLQPIKCRRSVVTTKLDEAAKRRWQAIFISAVRQSGQTYIPQIRPPAALADVLAAPVNGTTLIAHAGPDVPSLPSVLATSSENKRLEDVTLLIGPEGGWTDEELQCAGTHGFQAVQLGQTTLRVETAVVALTAAIICLCDQG